MAHRRKWLGVRRQGQRWRAQQGSWLERFFSEGYAVLARDLEAFRQHGEVARLNLDPAYVEAVLTAGGMEVLQTERGKALRAQLVEELGRARSD